jgi:FKBP-type peptidyl-prolyl cis-trans isomerase FkpA
MRNFILLLFFGMMVGFSACEATNPYNTGPVYDTEGNLKIDSAKIVAYLDTAKIDSIARIYDPSGVVIILQEEGVGTRPTSGTTIYTDYTGSLIEDGTIFDTSIESVAKANELEVEGRIYRPLNFVAGAGTVIPGWDYGFRRLRPGSKAVLIIPSPWAYRNQPSGKIPANAILRFDVEFVGID